jgi:CRISPR-associated protein Csm3
MSGQISFRKVHTLKGIVEVKTGLHVGAGKDTVEIGGIDSPVVKHPYSQQPYIPGSSLKGKLRSLLEWTLGCIEEDGKPYGSQAKGEYPPGNPILRIFGTSAESWQEGPGRAVVRDLPLVEQWARQIIGQGLPLTEEKAEVTIDRIKGKAASMGPRTMERVPAGARFELEILFKEYSVGGDEGRQDRRCLERLIEARRLLEQDALGGCGSRGYGRVKLTALELNGRPIQDQFEAIREVKREGPPTRFLEE